MSAPDKMPCLDEPCLSQLACQFSGSCRHRQIDAARSYEVAIAAMRQTRITTNQTVQTEVRSNE